MSGLNQDFYIVATITITVISFLSVLRTTDMEFFARLICLFLLANISAIASVTILSNGKNTLVAVLIGRITNKTLDDLKTHIGSLQMKSEPLNDFSNIQQDTALQKLTNQYNSIASQVHGLQMTIDSQSKMHQEAIAVQSKLLQVLETQSKMIQMIENKSKMFEEAVAQSNRHHSKIDQQIEEQSRKQQTTIDTQSIMLEMLRKIDAETTNRQRVYAQQKNTTDTQQSKIAEIIHNQSNMRKTQYETIQMLESIETKLKNHRESIDSQLKQHQAISDTQLNKTIEIVDTQAQILENFDVQSQKSRDNHAKIELKMDSQSETLQYIDTQLGDYQANIRSEISQMTEEQSEKLQALSDKQSEMQNKLENIDTAAASSEATLKLLEMVDNYSKKLQRSIASLATDTEDKINRMDNNFSQIFQILQNIDYQMRPRGQQTVPVPSWPMRTGPPPEMSGHTFQTHSENSHMTIGVRPNGPNPDWMYG